MRSCKLSLYCETPSDEHRESARYVLWEPGAGNHPGHLVTAGDRLPMSIFRLESGIPANQTFGGPWFHLGTKVATCAPHLQ